VNREFTASVYLIENQKVLLLYHVKLQKWLPPGGHLERDETPAEAARREVLEETGLEIEFIQQENLYLNYWNARSIERPYLCLLEDIPEYKQRAAHQHIDFIFVAKPIRQASRGTFTYRWFEWQDLQRLKPDIEIFCETLHVIQHLLETFSSKTSDVATSNERTIII
jgi:8-oxo-dGTP pyrophosphatase MutT (NUDIX family)